MHSLKFNKKAALVCIIILLIHLAISSRNAKTEEDNQIDTTYITNDTLNK